MLLCWYKKCLSMFKEPLISLITIFSIFVTGRSKRFQKIMWYSAKHSNHQPNYLYLISECILVLFLDSDEGSGLEDAVVGSESDDHWEELSEMDAEEDDVDETEIEDVHMSS